MIMKPGGIGNKTTVASARRTLELETKPLHEQEAEQQGLQQQGNGGCNCRIMNGISEESASILACFFLHEERNLESIL